MVGGGGSGERVGGAKQFLYVDRCSIDAPPLAERRGRTVVCRWRRVTVVGCAIGGRIRAMASDNPHATADSLC